MKGRYKSILAIGPTEEELDEHRWPLEVGALWLHGLLLRFCAFWWIIDRRESEDKYGTWDNARAAWVLCWLIVLIVIWITNPSGLLGEIFSGFAVLRLVEIVTSGFGTVLDRSQQARVRSLVTIAIYALQASLIFAILEHSWASNAFVNGHTHASQAFDFLYISWTDMTTLGNNIYTPTNDIARILQMLTAASGLFLFGVLLAFGINRLPKTHHKNTSK